MHQNRRDDAALRLTLGTVTMSSTYTGSFDLASTSPAWDDWKFKYLAFQIMSGIAQYVFVVFFFFLKAKTAFSELVGFVGSEMWKRGRGKGGKRPP